MARKTKQNNTHEFTKQIHSNKRRETRFANMNNWDEKVAKNENKLCCHDCRFFGYSGNCQDYIGMYHKPCELFEWW